MRYFLILLIIPYFDLIADHSWDRFCAEVPGWGDGQSVPVEAHYLASKVANSVDESFLLEKLGQRDWIVIDTRASTDIVMGKIPKTYHLAADYLDKQKNEFNKKNLLEVIKMHQERFVDSKNASSVLNYNYALFCNGRKCHRSTWAACELRRMGVPFERIHIFFDGFPKWRERGFPVR